MTSILELDKMTPMQGLQEDMYEEDTEDGKNKNDLLSGDGRRRDDSGFSGRLIKEELAPSVCRSEDGVL